VGEVTAPRTPNPSPSPRVRVVLPAPRDPDRMSRSPGSTRPANSWPRARMSSSVLAVTVCTVDTGDPLAVVVVVSVMARCSWSCVDRAYRARRCRVCPLPEVGDIGEYPGHTRRRLFQVPPTYSRGTLTPALVTIS